MLPRKVSVWVCLVVMLSAAVTVSADAPHPRIGFPASPVWLPDGDPGSESGAGGLTREPQTGASDLDG